MYQYRVELRTGIGKSKLIDITAASHKQARDRAERQYSLTVLSTELID